MYHLLPYSVTFSPLCHVFVDHHIQAESQSHATPAYVPSLQPPPTLSCGLTCLTPFIFPSSFFLLFFFFLCFLSFFLFSLGIVASLTASVHAPSGPVPATAKLQRQQIHQELQVMFIQSDVWSMYHVTLAEGKKYHCKTFPHISVCCQHFHIVRYICIQ